MSGFNPQQMIRWYNMCILFIIPFAFISGYAWFVLENEKLTLIFSLPTLYLGYYIIRWRSKSIKKLYFGYTPLEIYTSSKAIELDESPDSVRAFVNNAALTPCVTDIVIFETESNHHSVRLSFKNPLVCGSLRKLLKTNHGGEITIANPYCDDYYSIWVTFKQSTNSI